MSNTELFIERPMLLLLLIPVAALLIVPFFIFTRRRKTFGKIVSLVLRCLAGTALVLAIAGIGFKTTTEKQSVALLLDYSDSTLGVREQINKDALLYEKMIDENTPVHTFAFSGEQIYEVQRSEDGESYEAVEIVNGGATNIASAMEYAAAALPDEQAKRIILLSDGRQTDGSAEETARILRNAGVRVDAVCYENVIDANGNSKFNEDEMQLSAFDSPGTIHKGETARLTVTVDSYTDGEATLLVSENGAALIDGEPIKRIPVSIETGRNVFEVETTPATAGRHVYTVELQAEYDTISENNSRYCTVDVAGDGKVLIIAENVGDAYYMQRLLKERLTVDKVDLKSVYTAPSTIYELCAYDQVILVNVSPYDMDEGYDELLEEYVSVYGKSLLTFGGNSTYSIGGMTGTAFENFLPMEFKYERAQTDDTVAIMLVLDCSRSMVIYDPNIFVAAKDSAVRCLEAVSDADYMGIISFCSTAKVEYPIARATAIAKKEMHDVIMDMEYGPGTYYTDALNLAYSELIKSDAGIKHVIFLSDGEPMNDSGYTDAARRLQQAGVTISTIGLMAAGRYKPDALKKVAQVGNGQYYEVTDEKSLPDIMLSEAMSVSAGPLVLGENPVYVNKQTAETKNIAQEDIPSVRGYIGTTPKKDAEISLLVGEGDPLLLKWTYGKGTVSSFLSDAGVNWAESWKDSETGVLLFERMSEVIFETTTPSTALITQVEGEGQTMHVTLETALHGFAGSPELKVKYLKSETIVQMTPTGKNLYEADVTLDKIGMYEFTVSVYDRAKKVMDQTSFTYPVSYSSEYDAFAVGGKATLSDVTYLAGGRTVDRGGDTEALAQIEMGSVSYKRFFTICFVVLAFILFLVNVALCTLKIKDIKRFFARVAIWLRRRKVKN